MKLNVYNTFQTDALIIKLTISLFMENEQYKYIFGLCRNNEFHVKRVYAKNTIYIGT